jgi:hypothetical protein
MALKIKPPTHSADALGTFVSRHDSAWNNALYLADMKALQAAALAEAQDAAEAARRAEHPAVADEIATLRAACKLTEAQDAAAMRRHPVVRYMRGATRWQLDAPDWDPEGKPCTVRSRYLKPGAAEFTIRRLPYPLYQAADEISGSNQRLTAFARAGLRGVRSGDWTWDAEPADARAPEHVLQALHDADVSLPLELGLAVISLCRPLDDAETFR